jgi:hypothetical protein
MVYFQTQNHDLGKFGWVLEWNMLLYVLFGHCTAIYYIYCYLVYFWPFGIFYGYLVNFFPFWYVVPRKIWQPWVAISSHLSLFRQTLFSSSFPLLLSFFLFFETSNGQTLFSFHPSEKLGFKEFSGLGATVLGSQSKLSKENKVDSSFA